MSDGIQTRQFDGQPFGHRWTTSRLGDAPGAYGPPDPDGCIECGGRVKHAIDCPNRGRQAYLEGESNG